MGWLRTMACDDPPSDDARMVAPARERDTRARRPQSVDRADRRMGAAVPSILLVVANVVTPTKGSTSKRGER
jgi:hypothetical protein